MPVTIHGPSARICWSYRPAATLGPWDLTADETGTRLTAQIVTSEPFALTQQGLTFRWRRASGKEARWPILSLQIAGRTVSAQLGAEE